MSLALFQLKTKLSVKRRDGLLLAVFYAATGIAQLIILALSNFEAYPYGVLVALCFIAAYGLFTVKKWSVWLVIGLFFPQFVFATLTLYASILRYITYQEIAILLLSIGLVAFIVLTIISFVYVAANRKRFN
jgi:uncharacterized membrane protein (DUF2068 family)